MSMSTVEPGTRLAGRFRLEDRVSEFAGATLWKAIDEILARPVAVHTFSPEFPRVTEVVTAARAASRLSDPRLTQVFDAADEDGTAYVVSEWVSGDTLIDLLQSGSLEPERGAALVAEAAEALANAHEAGLTHLNLTPGCLVWTTGNTVKLLGLAVDAAIFGLTSDDPAREDAEGLGRLLYAALTGHWPGDADGGLPPAPLDDGRLCQPRQVVAGVPGYLDTIVCRVLINEAKRNQSPLVTPAEVAEALSDVPRPAPAPVTDAPPALNLNLRSATPDPSIPQAVQRPMPMPQAMAPLHTQTGPASKVLLTIIVLLVMAAVGFGAWTVGKTLGVKTTASPSPTAPSPSATHKPVKIKPVSADGFDPLGNDKNEKPQLAKNAIDGSSSTEWHTEHYNAPDLPPFKDGVGLILDMGKPVEISDVVVKLSGSPGYNLQLKVGDSKELSALKTVADEKGVSGLTTLTPTKSVTGQYVLIWFKRLPLYQGQYRGTIYDVTVHTPGPE